MVILNETENVAYYTGYKYSSIPILYKTGNMHGVKRVAVFCIMTTILPTILIITPLYLKHTVFADVIYPVAESDILFMQDGISTIFCEAHTLKMNTSFNAFQLNASPELSNKRKHIRLKKSMILPDDTLEYWGFYLLKGATVKLKVCSRYEGSRILVVRGERNLRTCGLLQHNLKKFGATMDEEHKQVKVTFDTTAQEIAIDDSLTQKNNLDDKNTAAEDLTGEDIENFLKLRKKKPKTNFLSSIDKSVENKSDTFNIPNIENQLKSETKRHHRKRHIKHKGKRKSSHNKNKLHLHNIQIEENLNNNSNLASNRMKRHSPGQVLDTRISHGGNAINYTKMIDSGSASSFESGLLTCYDGQILLTRGFSPSHLCTDVNYLETSAHMEAIHEVISDGYYYYIFYSDNDFVSNDIHAIFDIHKPTYQFANISESKGCRNQTECSFPLGFLSDETVIVEVPTRDGIEHEEDDITYLVSTCHPRMSVYMIFPISVLLLIMGCAFL